MEHISDEELTQYLEGSLPEQQQPELETHLLTCDDCRGRLAMFMRMMKSEESPEEAKHVERAGKRLGPTVPMPRKKVQIKKHWKRLGGPIVPVVWIPVLIGSAVMAYKGDWITPVVIIFVGIVLGAAIYSVNKRSETRRS